MKKTLVVNNLEDLLEGDIIFITGRREGFRVASTQTGPVSIPIVVDNPFDDGIDYVRENRSDHAERTIDEPEWPHPEDPDLHIYLGADGKQYLYAPSYEDDQIPWKRLPYYIDNDWHDAEEMVKYYPEALPLKELKLVPKEEES